MSNVRIGIWIDHISSHHLCNFPNQDFQPNLIYSTPQCWILGPFPANRILKNYFSRDFEDSQKIQKLGLHVNFWDYAQSRYLGVDWLNSFPIEDFFPQNYVDHGYLHQKYPKSHHRSHWIFFDQKKFHDCFLQGTLRIS